MRLVTDDSWLGEHVPISRDTQSPWCIGLELLGHSLEKPSTFRRVGQELRRFIKRVVACRRVTSDVALVNIGTVEQLHEVIAVRVVSDPAVGPHLILTADCGLDLIAEFA